jgi:hypothetical protein
MILMLAWGLVLILIFLFWTNIFESQAVRKYIYISYPQRGNYSDVVGSHILKLLNKGEYIKNIILI